MYICVYVYICIYIYTIIYIYICVYIYKYIGDTVFILHFLIAIWMDSYDCLFLQKKSGSARPAEISMTETSMDMAV